MSLPVVNIAVNYDDEKGSFIGLRSLCKADAYTEKIQGFLSTFVGEKDVTQGMANIGLGDEDDNIPMRTKSLKYMYQLVS